MTETIDYRCIKCDGMLDLDDQLYELDDGTVDEETVFLCSQCGAIFGCFYHDAEGNWRRDGVPQFIACPED